MAMIELRKEVEAAALAELNRANAKFPLFNSAHEGYAVILEKAEEAQEAITDPLIIEAALIYAKANFGNPENHGELMEAYDMICTKIKGGGYHRSNSDTVS